MKLKNIFVVVMVLVVVLTLAIRLEASAQRFTPPVPQGTRTVAEGLASVGVRYGNPSTPPVIPKAKAIEQANLRIGPMADQATAVLAEHVLFSDDEYYTTDANGQKRYCFQNVPAWVITFQGVTFEGMGPGRGQEEGLHVFNTEVNVVINATTGEYMMLFAYR